MNSIKKDKKDNFSNTELDRNIQLLDSKIRKKQLYLKTDLSVHDLSIETGISNEKIKQVLEQKYKINFFDFISRYKVDKAKRLLIQKSVGEFSISSIAMESGFNTEDSFKIVFQKHTQTTPDDYRSKYYNK